MAYTGKFTPKNPQKYKGNAAQITYRSLWERKFMEKCDTNPYILEWASEEIAIPYINPVDKSLHRYYVDFWIKVQNSKGHISCKLIEIKPYKQTVPPSAKLKKSKTYLSETKTYAVNTAKWKAADAFCKQQNWKFVILTEKELFG